MAKDIYKKGVPASSSSTRAEASKPYKRKANPQQMKILSTYNTTSNNTQGNTTAVVQKRVAIS